MLDKKQFKAYYSRVVAAATTQEAIFAIHQAERVGANVQQVEMLRAGRPKHLFSPSHLNPPLPPPPPRDPEVNSNFGYAYYGEYDDDYSYPTADSRYSYTSPADISTRIKTKLAEGAAVVALPADYKNIFVSDPSEKFLKKLCKALREAGIEGFYAPYSKFSTPRIRVITFKT